MAARQYYYAETTAQATTTSSTYQDFVTLTFTPDASATYLLIGSVQHQESFRFTNMQVRLINTTGSITYQQLNNAPFGDANPYYSSGLVGIYTASASPVSQTFKIQYNSQVATDTCRVKNGSLVAIKLTASDTYVEQLTRQTMTGTTPTTKATLTFTPATAGDYLLIMGGEVDTGTTSDWTNLKMVHSSTDYCQVGYRLYNASSTQPWPHVGIVKKSLTAISQSVTAQLWTSFSSTVCGVSNLRLVALRLDGFDNTYYAENQTRATTTSTTYVDEDSLTATPQAVDHLVLMSATPDQSVATTGLTNVASVAAGTTYVDSASNQYTTAYNSTNKVPTTAGFFSVKKRTESNTSTVWKMQLSANGTSTAGLNYQAISVLQLGATPLGGGSTFPTLSLLGVGS